MNVQAQVIPKNWKPGNHKAVARWMENLPPVYDIAGALEIQEIFENKFKHLKK